MFMTVCNFINYYNRSTEKILSNYFILCDLSSICYNVTMKQYLYNYTFIKTRLAIQ